MVDQTVAALSSFRLAASQANEYVSQLFGGLLISASKTREASKELSDTAKASSRNDDRIRSESNEAAAAASEIVSLGNQILSELKEFSKNFTSLISGEGGSFVDSIFGMGLVGVSLAGGYNIDELDVNQDTIVNASYSNPETGFESVEINGINFAPGAITSPNSEGAHNETGRYASQQNIDTTVNMFSQMQGQFGGSLTVNDFIPRAGTDRSPPSSGGGSMHWYGKAMDISTAGMNDKDKLRLVEAALTSGFKGFGFGNNILHVDWGGSRAWGYRNGVWTSDLKGLEYGGMPVEKLASWVSGGQKPEEVITALEASPLSEPTSEPPPSAAEDEMALDTPQAQETNDVTQVAGNDVETNDVTQVAGNDVETNAQQPAEITQASFSNPETPGMPETSIAMAETDFEAVNFEPAETTSPTPAVDLSLPATNYRTASLSGTSSSKPVVTPAVNYPATKENTIDLASLPATKTPKLIDVKFDTNWISEANGKKQKTNETWMA